MSESKPDPSAFRMGRPRINPALERASDIDVSKVEVELRKRPLPDHLYVDIPTVTSTISKLVFLVCIFSLAMSFLADVDMIHPFVAIIISIGCICFYIMSRMVANKYSDNV
jgi:hypothetical protein